MGKSPGTTRFVFGPGFPRTGQTTTRTTDKAYQGNAGNLGSSGLGVVNRAVSESAGLRFAMVTTFYPPYHFGGDAYAVRRLAHALARRGHQVDVIHDIDAFRALGGSVELTSEPEPENVRVHGLESPFGTLSCLATHQFGRPVVHGRKIRAILGQGFDVIHFHNISLVGGPGILEYGTGIKLYTAHEHWLVCPSHTLWRHNREICNARECLRCIAHYRRPPQLWRHGTMLEQQVRHVDAFTTYSQFCADKHREFGFTRPMSVTPPFLPNAEAPEQEPGSARDPEDPPYFLFVGRLEAIKGLQDVIPLFRKAGTAELRVAGSGIYENQLRKLAADAPRVRFLGKQSRAQLRELYRGAVALIVPSICYEVFALVILEAFREGTPVVARRLGPFPEIIDQSGGGLLFDDATGLEQALEKLLGSDELRARLGAAAARVAQSVWSETWAMKRYFELIADVAQRRGDSALREKALNSIPG